MTPRRYFSQFSNMPIPDHIKDLNLGPNLWFAFTAISGISNLFTYTPPKTEGGQAAAESEGTEDIPDTKSP
jgi:hypothetical protein